MSLLDDKPDVSYADIGGMDIQKQEVREAVELPLTHFELYKQIGIDPPRGVLMFGPPGCGKTMLAKAVAHHTTGLLLFNISYLSRSRHCIYQVKLPFINKWQSHQCTWNDMEEQKSVAGNTVKSSV